ncbi:uncharacterized protein AMSG_03393 [Thecamonas trahens ATCC 50062]|uniref:PPPDE domain-containing protein n=1 Tax=Thecamonas trahens ATCC 50062 TaxID=461836 RepID=A0A0L0D3Z0_THETB|nr:hypothetical protein AMSG_03393 [Thecamonas trahens ATCC 50062]KNC46960.1 hypothetical protein AMSG_03393 [Thecamonas trahens ATCC 50062]|eukprot:XP_013760231.1 hypothetical protein AMSG_03393 [Thecamonas trahens ATCC 50062]
MSSRRSRSRQKGSSRSQSKDARSASKKSSSRSRRASTRAGGAQARARLADDEYPAPPQPSAISNKDVFLNVYDLSHEPAVAALNSLFQIDLRPPSRGRRSSGSGRGRERQASMSARVYWSGKASKSLGGAFHAGIEVRGKEWSFGRADPDSDIPPSATGVFAVEPRLHPMHRYRCTVYLGQTSAGWLRVRRLISQLKDEFCCGDYHLLRNNCVDFCAAAAAALGVAPPPEWVNRWAKTALRAMDSSPEAKAAALASLGIGLGAVAVAAASWLNRALGSSDTATSSSTTTATMTTSASTASESWSS